MTFHFLKGIFNGLFLIGVIITCLNAQNQITVPDLLTREEAVALALKNHPSLQAADANIRSSSAQLTQSESGYYPVMSYTAGASHIQGAFVFNPSFPARHQLYNSYTTGLQLQQTIYDFGKTGGRVSANKHLVEASTFDYQSARDNVATNVQLSYFNILQAQRVIKVNEEAVAQSEKHLEKARAFYSVGRRPQFDVTKANVEVANANVNLIRSRNLLRIAKVQLENAMGIHPTSNYTLADTFEVQPFAMDLNSAKVIAFKNRPELRSARARVEFNESLVEAEWSQHLPTLLASYVYTWNGFHLPLASRYTAGVTFSLPIFQGFSVYARVQQAKANVDVAKANTDMVTESVMLDVEQNYLELKEAEERIGATSKLVEQAEENLRTAEGRYNAGVGSAIEITDAQVLLSSARITNIQALYDYNSSLIKLYRAMGTINQASQ